MLYSQRWDVSPGFIARKHEMEADLEEMRRDQMERELCEALRALKSYQRMKTYLNMFFFYNDFPLEVRMKAGWRTQQYGWGG